MNKRKQFAYELGKLSKSELQALLDKTKADYSEAYSNGYVTMYCVLWFDIKQIEDALARHDVPSIHTKESTARAFAAIIPNREL